MTNDLFKLLIGMGIGAYLYRLYAQRYGVTPVKSLPAGAQTTGRVAKTTTGGRPGEETVGYKEREFAEIQLPNGIKDWVEIRVRK